MKHDLLLIVDLQVVYQPGQPWACQSMNKTIEKILELLHEVHAHPSMYLTDQDIAFTRFLAPDHPHGSWRNYNEAFREINETPVLNEMVPPFTEGSATVTAPDLPSYPLYSKSVYSSMKIPKLQEISRNCRQLVLCGVVSECCVLATALDAIDFGIPVVFLTDGVSGLDREREHASELVLGGLSPVQCRLMSIEDYLKANS